MDKEFFPQKRMRLVFFVNRIHDRENCVHIILRESAQPVFYFKNLRILRSLGIFVCHVQKVIKRNSKKTRDFECGVGGRNTVSFDSKTDVRGIKSDGICEFFPRFSQIDKF